MRSRATEDRGAGGESRDKTKRPAARNEEAKRLAGFIIFKAEGNEDAARALIRLVNMIADEQGFVERDQMRLCAEMGAFALSDYESRPLGWLRRDVDAVLPPPRKETPAQYAARVVEQKRRGRVARRG